MAVVPDPRLAQLLAAVRALRDGDLDARALIAGDDELAELGALFDQLTGREDLRLSLREREQQLQQASQAKAEFLVNISQELRTPLSSVLILAKLLAANAEGTLTPRQLDFARTIHGAAQDLLQLINDLLDLSKVESGRMEMRADQVAIAGLVADAEATFGPQAEEKGLTLNVRVADDAPPFIEADEHRLQQILRNLLSNAVKFTEHGSVTLEVYRDPADPGRLRFAVRDTGIGIASGRQHSVFDPFQRDDGFSGQRFVGTGLGLSISRELARLFGGSLTVESTPGQGSTFTLTLPITPEPAGHARAELAAANAAASAASAGIDSDKAEDYGLRPHVTQPSVVLVVEPRRAQAMQAAARSALDGLGGLRGRVEVLAVHDGGSGEIEQLLTERDVVAVVVNLTAPQPQALFAAVAEYAPQIPVLAYEAGAGSGTEARLEAALDSEARIELVGSRAQTVERLTLHLLTAMPGAETSFPAESSQSTMRFHGEKVLVVDDDVRNVFAMTSMLELHGLSVVHADNGRQGIEMLLANPDIRLVLMDLMMPGMDGYTAIEYIRSLSQFSQLPIIAVTAKAMRDDRQRSLAVGANEHVVKPVEVDVLLGVIGSMLS